MVLLGGKMDKNIIGNLSILFNIIPYEYRLVIK